MREGAEERGEPREVEPGAAAASPGRPRSSAHPSPPPARRERLQRRRGRAAAESFEVPGRNGLRPRALRGAGGGGAAVQALRAGAGRAAVHAVRARLLRRLPAALGGAAPALPAALPAARRCRAAPRAAPAQPRPEAGGQVRLQPAGLRPRRAAPGAARPPRRVPLWAAAGCAARGPGGRRRAAVSAGAAGRRRSGAGAGDEEGGPALEQEREVAVGAALGAAERGAADGAALPGQVRAVHEPHQQHHPRPDGQPARQGECGYPPAPPRRRCCSRGAPGCGTVCERGVTANPEDTQPPRVCVGTQAVSYPRTRAARSLSRPLGAASTVPYRRWPKPGSGVSSGAGAGR